MAERGGFEPPRRYYRPTGIRSQTLQPLGYLSTALPTYWYSKPDPSATWVPLHSECDYSISSYRFSTISAGRSQLILTGPAVMSSAQLMLASVLLTEAFARLFLLSAPARTLSSYSAHKQQKEYEQSDDLERIHGCFIGDVQV